MAKNLYAQKFNRDGEFIARHRMNVKGTIILPGEKINKGLFTTRRLRQLWDARKILSEEAYQVHVLRGRKAPGRTESVEPTDPTADPANVDDGSRLPENGPEAPSVEPNPASEADQQDEQFDAPEEKPSEEEPEANETAADAEKPIPEGWQKLAANPMKELARELTGEKAGSKIEAEVIIEEEIRRRARRSNS